MSAERVCKQTCLSSVDSYIGTGRAVLGWTSTPPNRSPASPSTGHYHCYHTVSLLGLGTAGYNLPCLLNGISR